MSPTYDIIPHRLIPGISIDSASAPENLTVTNNNAGGYGSAEWDQRSNPPAVGEPVVITSEGVNIFEGKVASVTSGIGERTMHHITCVGRQDDLKQDETFAGVFVDRDLAQLRLHDCGNWAAAPGFEISVSAEDNRLLFSWPETDKLIVDRGDPDDEDAVKYEHDGNALPPHWKKSDFPRPKALWTAAVYLLGDGATTHSITGISFEAVWNLGTPKLDAKKTADYTSPIGPPDEKYGHRFARYPKINYWLDFYRLKKPPDNAFLGVYVCDSADELPVTDPFAMRTDPHLLHRFDAHTRLTGRPRIEPRRPGEDRGAKPFSLAVEPLKLRFSCRGKMLVIYAAYLPVRLPYNLATRYSRKADHLVRTKWVATNRIYAEPGQYVEIRNLSICSQGYESKADGSDDLADVFRIMFPGCECEAMPLPSPLEDTAPTSIAVRSRTTKLAAISELLSLYPSPMCWGIWEDGVLKIESEAGTFELTDEPGVDTTQAAKSDEGAVDLVMVTYTPKPRSSLSDVGTLAVDSAALLLVDAEGNVAIPNEHWRLLPGVVVAHIDARGTANSMAAAARIGQLEAIARRRGQWRGQVVLRGIEGASAIRPGMTLSGAGLDGALVTSVTVSVDDDTVTLALGSSGYLPRFGGRIPGKPATAAPPGLAYVSGVRTPGLAYANAGRRRT